MLKDGKIKGKKHRRQLAESQRIITRGGQQMTAYQTMWPLTCHHVNSKLKIFALLNG